MKPGNPGFVCFFNGLVVFAVLFAGQIDPHFAQPHVLHLIDCAALHATKATVR